MLCYRYLAMKFQEMEEKMRLERKRPTTTEAHSTEDTGNVSSNNNDNSDTTVKEDNAKKTEEALEIYDDNNKQNNNIEEVVIREKRPQKHDTINSHITEQSSQRNLLIDDEVEDVSQRDTLSNEFASTTLSTLIANIEQKENNQMVKTSKNNTSVDGKQTVSFQPIVVSATLDLDDDKQLIEKRKSVHGKGVEQLSTNEIIRNNSEAITNDTLKMPIKSTPKDTVKITVEKIEMIEIKSDDATGNLIPPPEMLAKQTSKTT